MIWEALGVPRVLSEDLQGQHYFHNSAIFFFTLILMSVQWLFLKGDVSGDDVAALVASGYVLL